jgi:hypothetical protein
MMSISEILLYLLSSPQVIAVSLGFMIVLPLIFSLGSLKPRQERPKKEKKKK